MAKMFYTLEEAAEKLGLDENAVKEMAASGKLQQFRDRDKLMFKRDQVDAMISSSQGDTGMDESGIPLASSGDTDAIDLAADDTGGDAKPEDPREATGVSVFDANEVSAADPLAQTQVNAPLGSEEEELALESVGSGSGLLDLTRESDDTSLGAELLDEIYPGGGEGSDSGFGSAVGSSAAFDSAVAGDTGVSGPSGLENLGAAQEAGEGPAAAPAAARAIAYEGEPHDPAGSGLGAGFLLVMFIALVLGMMISTAALFGTQNQALTMLQEGNNLYMVAGGLAVGSIIFGVIGMVIGKAASR